jgi:hypothetical protein
MTKQAQPYLLQAFWHCQIKILPSLLEAPCWYDIMTCLEANKLW